MKLLCNKTDCPKKDCIHHCKSLRKRSADNTVVAHLEDNPLYCKKANWYGNQVNPKKQTRRKRNG